MANTFEANMNKATKVKKVSKWWANNGDKILRVVLFPIYVCGKAIVAIRNWNYERVSYSNLRTKKILDYAIPKRIARTEMDSNEGFLILESDYENAFYGIVINELGYDYFEHCMSKRDRTYYNKFKRKIWAYIQNDYEIEGFNKTLGNTETFVEKCPQYRPYSESTTKNAVYFFKK